MFEGTFFSHSLATINNRHIMWLEVREEWWGRGGVKKSQQKYNLRTATIMHTDTRMLYMHAICCRIFFYKLPTNPRHFTELVFYFKKSKFKRLLQFVIFKYSMPIKIKRSYYKRSSKTDWIIKMWKYFLLCTNYKIYDNHLIVSF